jgi:hypothetical protein
MFMCMCMVPMIVRDNIDIVYRRFVGCLRRSIFERLLFLEWTLWHTVAIRRRRRIWRKSSFMTMAMVVRVIVRMIGRMRMFVINVRF